MDADQQKTDCSVRVITPENIAFEYQLAGPAQRVIAWAVDLTARCFLYVGGVIGISLIGALLSLSAAFATIFAILSYFLLSWFYGIFFETRFNGQTPGKMLLGLRVISTDGRPINALQAAIRNFLRMADMAVLVSLQVLDPEAPPAYIIPTFSVGLVAMTLSPRFQRVGDLAAGTMVIAERYDRRLVKITPDDQALELAESIPPTMPITQTLARAVGMYMERRGRLHKERRAEVASRLAEVLIQRMGLPPNIDADLLLCALYVHIYLSEQEREQLRKHWRQRLRKQKSAPRYDGEPPVAPPIIIATVIGDDAEASSEAERSEPPIVQAHVVEEPGDLDSVRRPEKQQPSSTSSLDWQQEEGQRDEH